MAFEVKDVKNLAAVRVICPHDPALDKEAMADTDILELYEEDPIRNESLLKFKEGMLPSIFVCNMKLSGKESARIKDSMAGGQDDDKNMKISYGSWEYAVVKTILKDIQNPGSIKFKKDSKGYVAESTMSELEQFGIVQHLFVVYMKLSNPEVKDSAKN